MKTTINSSIILTAFCLIISPLQASDQEDLPDITDRNSGHASQSPEAGENANSSNHILSVDPQVSITLEELLHLAIKSYDGNCCDEDRSPMNDEYVNRIQSVRQTFGAHQLLPNIFDRLARTSIITHKAAKDSVAQLIEATKLVDRVKASQEAHADKLQRELTRAVVLTEYTIEKIQHSISFLNQCLVLATRVINEGDFNFPHHSSAEYMVSLHSAYICLVFQPSLFNAIFDAEVILQPNVIKTCYALPYKDGHIRFASLCEILSNFLETGIMAKDQAEAAIPTISKAISMLEEEKAAIKEIRNTLDK